MENSQGIKIIIVILLVISIILGITNLSMINGIQAKLNGVKYSLDTIASDKEENPLQTESEYINVDNSDIIDKIDEAEYNIKREIRDAESSIEIGALA